MDRGGGHPLAGTGSGHCRGYPGRGQDETSLGWASAERERDGDGDWLALEGFLRCCIIALCPRYSVLCAPMEKANRIVHDVACCCEFTALSREDEG